MDIKNLQNNLNASRSSDLGKPTDKSVGNNDNGTTPSDTTDRVTLTDVLSQVRDLEAKSTNIEVDNSARIAELKAAIADGSYQVDSKSIASKLIQTELLLQK